MLARSGETLTFGPSDRHARNGARAGRRPGDARGPPVPVHYDLTVRRRSTGQRAANPQLIISSINHWSPFAAPLYRIAYSAPLTGTTARSRCRPRSSPPVAASTAPRSRTPIGGWSAE